MARQSADPVFALLARKRPEFSSAHFGLSVLTDGARLRADGIEHPVSTTGGSSALGFSVPKRVLVRAVDRNAVRRVAREAWRAARWLPGRQPLAAMIKLRGRDPLWAQMSRPMLKKIWRTELDALIDRLNQRAGQGLRGGSRHHRPEARSGRATRDGKLVSVDARPLKGPEPSVQ